MAFTTLDQVVAALPGQRKSFMKPSITAKAAGTFTDLFLAPGIPAAASAPAAYGAGGTAYSSVSAGAIPWTNPATGAAYIARCLFTGATQGTLILYDRLWACTGMSGTVTTAQTIASFPGLPARGGLGAYVEPWIEWYTATGATASTVTMAYTNSAGTTGRATTSTTFQATPTVYQMQPLPLQQGDIGVRTPVSVTITTTGTAGAFGVTLLKRILEVPIPIANVGTSFDVFSLGLPDLLNDTCLAAMVMCSTTSTGMVAGDLSIISG